MPAFLIAGTRIARHAKVTPLWSKDFAECLGLGGRMIAVRTRLLFTAGRPARTEKRHLPSRQLAQTSLDILGTFP